MQNAPVSNPKDFQVVSFRNSTDFDFTPVLGCMYDGRAINGMSGKVGIAAGESMTLPYHVGRQLALNLAKLALTKRAPAVDAAGIPTGVPLWDPTRLELLQNSYLTDLYSESKPLALSETDRLMAKVEEYKAMVEKLIPGSTTAPVETPAVETTSQEIFTDKQEVITELEKRGIVHDKRKSKAELEKLLA